MTSLTLPSGCVVEFYDSARKLPESRRVEADCYQLIESGVGSSIDDVDRHFDGLLALANADRKDEFMTAINNLRYLFFNLLHKQLSARSLSLACLVATVDGQPWEDWTEEGLERLVKRLSDEGLTDEMVAETLPAVKKN
ncbi:hypothetical protein [Larkinella soli]|uniref:hypothetical protein n=1 Tax=Larkinella soli TaxID=1770527 RepID=UPI000FFB45B5|nr:hypothetical protein [Larkinella soli]